jgi:hypothetical protein
MENQILLVQEGMTYKKLNFYNHGLYGHPGEGHPHGPHCLILYNAPRSLAGSLFPPSVICKEISEYFRNNKR